MNGWVRLWRKTKDSDLFLHDATAWRVFEYLLMSADFKTGKYTSGRHRDSSLLEMKPMTFYDALKRLELKWRSINIESNNRYSIISILNWDKYQPFDNTSDNITPTSDRHLTDTKEEEKKERRKEENKNPADGFSLPKELETEIVRLFPRLKLELSIPEMFKYYGDRGITPTEEQIKQWCANDVKWKKNLRPLTTEEEIDYLVKNKGYKVAL